ncbi:hypothetical protein AAFF_G00305750 [Aldrovandia affinis]|uniref:Uncharacterized protein n=1 Tax=Aldrovandia affinis TaxID=143900 RepID=A0AAD7SP82_9TELE|nr:hypothetical protein AAFF_G00305750 [Aldrovandia affinis]
MVRVWCRGAVHWAQLSTGLRGLERGLARGQALACCTPVLYSQQAGVVSPTEIRYGSVCERQAPVMFP